MCPNTHAIEQSMTVKELVKNGWTPKLAYILVQTSVKISTTAEDALTACRELRTAAKIIRPNRMDGLLHRSWRRILLCNLHLEGKRI